MNRAGDLQYLALLGGTALLGPLHRRVEGVAARRRTASAIGVAQICAVMGARHAWHALLAVALGALLVRATRDRHRHVVVGAAMILYLCAFRLYVYSDWLANIHQNLLLMIVTIKMIGLAYETKSNSLRYPDEDSAPVDPGFADILHYAFCYVGLLSGPYIRYRTYDDFIKLPFSRTAVVRDNVQKLASIAFFFLCVLVITEYWPISYMRTDEFAARSLFYKMTYGMIQTQMFRCWLYVGLLFSEVSSSAHGLGAYPVRSECKPAHGPTKGHRSLVEISRETAASVECDFVTIAAIDPWFMEKQSWFSLVVLKWNMSAQYVLGACIYRSIPKTPKLKPFRALITGLISGLWHGLHLGNMIAIPYMVIYVFAEGPFMKIHKQLSGWRASLLSCLAFVAMRYLFGYAITVLLLMEVNAIITYTIQVKFIPIILTIVLPIIGSIVLKKRCLKTNGIRLINKKTTIE